MIDIRLIRENPELVRENIKKKFQEQKLPLVDRAIELDRENRAAIDHSARGWRRTRLRINSPRDRGTARTLAASSGR